METSGHVDGSGWIEMGHEQLCPNEPDLAGRTDEVNISEMIEFSDLPVLPLLLLMLSVCFEPESCRTKLRTFLVFRHFGFCKACAFLPWKS